VMKLFLEHVLVKEENEKHLAKHCLPLWKVNINLQSTQMHCISFLYSYFNVFAMFSSHMIETKGVALVYISIVTKVSKVS